MFEKVAGFVFLHLTLIKYHRKCWVMYFVLLCILLVLP